MFRINRISRLTYIFNIHPIIIILFIVNRDRILNLINSFCTNIINFKIRTIPLRNDNLTVINDYFGQLYNLENFIFHMSYKFILEYPVMICFLILFFLLRGNLLTSINGIENVLTNMTSLK